MAAHHCHVSTPIHLHIRAHTHARTYTHTHTYTQTITITHTSKKAERRCSKLRIFCFVIESRSHVTHTRESCRVTYNRNNESCLFWGHESCHTYEKVIPQIRMSLVSHERTCHVLLSCEKQHRNWEVIPKCPRTWRWILTCVSTCVFICVCVCVCMCVCACIYVYR